MDTWNSCSSRRSNNRIPIAWNWKGRPERRHCSIRFLSLPYCPIFKQMNEEVSGTISSHLVVHLSCVELDVATCTDGSRKLHVSDRRRTRDWWIAPAVNRRRHFSFCDLCQRRQKIERETIEGIWSSSPLSSTWPPVTFVLVSHRYNNHHYWYTVPSKSLTLHINRCLMLA